MLIIFPNTGEKWIVLNPISPVRRRGPGQKSGIVPTSMWLVAQGWDNATRVPAGVGLIKEGRHLSYKTPAKDAGVFV